RHRPRDLRTAPEGPADVVPRDGAHPDRSAHLDPDLPEVSVDAAVLPAGLRAVVVLDHRRALSLCPRARGALDQAGVRSETQRLRPSRPFLRRLRAGDPRPRASPAQVAATQPVLDSLPRGLELSGRSGGL